jgi:DNA-directed RNA polymerase specialized sigma subunit
LAVVARPGNSAAEVEGWLRAYAAGRDPRLRERIILAFLGLADRLAARYRRSRGTSLEDLTQTARAGLISAVDRYEPGRRGGFVPFAVACVVGELKRYIRDTSWRELSLDQPVAEDDDDCLGDRLLADARVAAAPPGAGPHAHPASGALKRSPVTA